MHINEPNLKKIVKVSFMEHNSACQGWIPLFNPQYPRVYPSLFLLEICPYHLDKSSRACSKCHVTVI